MSAENVDDDLIAFCELLDFKPDASNEVSHSFKADEERIHIIDYVVHVSLVFSSANKS